MTMLPFVVRSSRLPKAGDGLFANVYIPKDALFPVLHRRPRSSSACGPRHEVLDYFVDLSALADDAICCHGSRLLSYGDMDVHPSAQTPRYIHVPVDEEPLMKANDKAWLPEGCTAEEYEARTHLNALEFVLQFGSDGRICGVMARALRAIQCDEEIGITYGYAYWS